MKLRTQRFVAAAFTVLAVMVEPQLPAGEAAEKNSGAPKIVKLPGMEIKIEERCLDLDATISLATGTLELIACTKGTKEHESIVFIDALPRTVHAGLLTLGAQAGNPAISEQVGGDEKHWVELPPRGDPISVFLVFRDDAGEMREHPIKNFVKPAVRDIDVENYEEAELAAQKIKDGARAEEKNKVFPETFLFTGSRIIANPDDPKMPRRYLSDESGNVISLTTFGDETLGLAEISTHENGSLAWQVNNKKLPKVGTKVVLRLRPAAKPVDAKTDGARPAVHPNNSPTCIQEQSGAKE